MIDNAILSFHYFGDIETQFGELPVDCNRAESPLQWSSTHILWVNDWHFAKSGWVWTYSFVTYHTYFELCVHACIERALFPIDNASKDTSEGIWEHK